jgi:7-cyano-7-deazaguanine synthase
MQAKVFAPFLHSEKWEIIEEGVKMETPYQLTRTCYKENELACGKCGSCVERLESFARVGVEDPIEYVKNPLDKNLKLV